MSHWPEVDGEKQADTLLRVDLYEGRYLAVGEHAHVVNLLLRAAASACLLDREEDALALVARAAARMFGWIEAVQGGQARAGGFVDLAATRGLLAVALDAGRHAIAPSTATIPASASSGANSPVRDAVGAAKAFLALTADAPPGSVHNARLVAAALLGDADAVRVAAGACALSDPGLGLPWRRFATGLESGDATQLARNVTTWLREKEEATRTSEWGDYDDVPIEVSGALALAERAGVPVRVASTRVLTRFRA